MSHTTRQPTHSFHLPGLEELRLHFFQIRDIRGDLYPDQAAVSPFNGPIVIDIILSGDRVLAFPDMDPSRISIFVDQLIICTAFAGF